MRARSTVKHMGGNQSPSSGYVDAHKRLRRRVEPRPRGLRRRAQRLGSDALVEDDDRLTLLLCYSRCLLPFVVSPGLKLRPIAAQCVQNVEVAISAAPHGPASRRGTFVSHAARCPDKSWAIWFSGSCHVACSILERPMARLPSTQTGVSAWSSDSRGAHKYIRTPRAGCYQVLHLHSPRGHPP